MIGPKATAAPKLDAHAAKAVAAYAARGRCRDDRDGGGQHQRRAEAFDERLAEHEHRHRVWRSRR